MWRNSDNFTLRYNGKKTRVIHDEERVGAVDDDLGKTGGGSLAQTNRQNMSLDYFFLILYLLTSISSVSLLIWGRWGYEMIKKRLLNQYFDTYLHAQPSELRGPPCETSPLCYCLRVLFYFCFVFVRLVGRRWRIGLKFDVCCFVLGNSLFDIFMKGSVFKR